MRPFSTLALTGLLVLSACDKIEDTGDLTDADGDGYYAWEDCNDRDPLVYPGSSETCDGRDNDCDGEIDEGATVTLYRDADLDGYGDPDTETTGCPGTGGYSTDNTDCDDENHEVHPGAEEWCDGLDNDCNGTADDGIDYVDWYADADGDGYGDPESVVNACQQPKGTIEDGGDCDDTDAAINPEAIELCDGEDNDCDGTVDEADATDATTWYADADGDGYGDAADKGTPSCDNPGAHTTDHTDCDDGDAAVNPGAIEICDDADVDEDCDGAADDADDSTDYTTMTAWYMDSDSDGYGDPRVTTRACEQPSGFLADGSDCDDSDDQINPGMPEICDGEDNDCDGDTDDDDASLMGAPIWFVDADGDGYGSNASTLGACTQPTGYVDNADDCDDGDAGLTTDCPADTGDTGEAFSRDGTYNGTFEILAEETTLGISDTCTGTIQVEVDEAGVTQLLGRGNCTFSGLMAPVMGTQATSIDGSITSDPDCEGTVTLGSGPAIILTDDWTGTFTDDDTLYGEFDGSTSYMGYAVDYVGAFEVVR
jgi:hypothetical protein